MKPDLTIRRLEPGDGALYRAVRLRSLADSPDAFGSTVAAEEAYPAGQWSARLAAAAVSGRDLPLVAERSGAAIGLLWARFDAADPSLVNLFQMWVAPEARGGGVAAALLREAFDWAASNGARTVQLGVTCSDTPAVRLYAREGFVAFGAPEPLREGSALLSQCMRMTLACPEPG